MAELPCSVFVILCNKELIAEFGNDVTLKTDFNPLYQFAIANRQLARIKRPRVAVFR
jgi:hypothetical protein